MAKDKFTKPLVRTQMDAVTGEMHHAILDKPQVAFDMARGYIENRLRDLNNSEASRFLDKVILWCLRMQPRQSDDELSLLRELVLKQADRIAEQAELLAKQSEKKTELLAEAKE